MSKFDAAIRSLLDRADALIVKMPDEFSRESIALRYEAASLMEAIRVLKAAGKVDKKKSIDALEGIFVFASIHGINKPDPDVISAMNLLKSLPDESPSDVEAKEGAEYSMSGKLPD